MRLLTKAKFVAHVIDHIDCTTYKKSTILNITEWDSEGNPLYVEDKFSNTISGYETINSDPKSLPHTEQYTNVDFDTTEADFYNRKTCKVVRKAKLVDKYLLADGKISRITNPEDYIPYSGVTVHEVRGDKVVFSIGELTGITTIVDGTTTRRIVPNSLNIPITWDDILGEQI